MAINLDNVKAITHNNKDVIKIEDSNGNTIWTKPSQDEYLYYLRNEYSYTLNTRTLEFTLFDAGSYAAPTSHQAWTDGTDVYISSGATTDSRYQRKINFNGTSTNTVSHTSWTGLPSSFYGQYVFTDGTDVYYADSTGIRSVYKKTAGTDTWTSYTIGGVYSGFTGGNMFRFNGTTYCIKDSNHIVRWDTTNNQWLYVKNVSGTSTALTAKGFWSPDNVHLFYTDGTYNYRFNPSNFTYDFCSWSGPSISSTAVDKMFMIGSDVYMITGSSGSVIYKLDLTTLDNSTLVWTDVTSQFTMPSDFYITGLILGEDGEHTPACIGVNAHNFN